MTGEGTITDADIAILDQQEPMRLAQWWSILNCWDWPEALPDPEPPPEGPPPQMPKMRRRSMLLRLIEGKLGGRDATLRMVNKVRQFQGGPNVNAEIAKTRPPDIKLILGETEYNRAFQFEFAVWNWIANNSLAFRSDLYGIIEQPGHPQCPPEQWPIPDEVKRLGGWSLTVRIWAANAAALNWLRSLQLPENSRLEEVDEHGK